MSNPKLLSGAWRRWGIIAALALAVAGCSLASLGYNRAATLAYWWIDGYADLMPEQGRRLRDALDTLHRWHRVNELPRYAARLRDWQALARRDITPEAACREFEATRSLLLPLGERALEPLAPLAASLGPEQLAHLQREQAKSNRDYRRDFVTPDHGLDERLKRMANRLEMFYGTLEPEQRRLLRTHLARSSFDATRVLAERERRQADVVRAARLARDGDAPAAVRGVWLRLLDSPTPGWTAYAATLTREGCEGLAALHNSTTAAQRERAVVALAGYEREFLTLAGQD